MLKEQRYILIFCLLTALLPILSVDMQRSLSYTSGLIAVIFYAAYYWVFDQKPYFSKRTLWFTLLVLGLTTLSLIWAKFFDTSLAQVAKLCFLLPPQILVISLVLSLTKEQLKPYIHFFAYGVIIGCLLLVFELLSGGMAYNFIRNQPLDTRVNPAEFNRASVIIVLYFFSAITLLSLRFKKIYAACILALPLFGTLFIMDSQSAQLAFVVGVSFLCLFPYKSKTAWLGLKLLILTIMLSAPFSVSYIYENYAQNVQDFFIMSRGYAGYRLEIWDYVTRYAAQAPLHGFGIDSTRQIIDFDSKLAFHNINTVTNPHNFVFQIWIELGVIGILASMALMWKGLSLIQCNFSIAQQRILLPTAMAALIPASTAYDIWQGWWIALLFHVTAMALIACKFVNNADEKKQ